MNVCYATARLGLRSLFIEHARQLAQQAANQPSTQVQLWIDDELPRLGAVLGLAAGWLGAGARHGTDLPATAPASRAEGAGPA